jgi:hypothetical protein
MARKPTPQVVEIYGLLDPRDGKLRYIGKANDAGKRLKTHVSDSRRRNTAVCKWIAKLVADNLIPKVLVLEACDASLWECRERAWISEAYRMGGVLLNVAPGGAEPVEFPYWEFPCGRLIDKKSPAGARIKRDKITANRRLRDGLMSPIDRWMLRECARMVPGMFGEWANI